jgi:hypothetical protein
MGKKKKSALKGFAKSLRRELTEIKRNMRKSTNWGGRRRRK